MAKSEPNLNVNSISRISSGTIIKGEILSPYDIRIDGTFEGKVQTKGRVVVGETAFVKGDIICENIDLWGKVDGNLFVKDTLSLMEKVVFDSAFMFAYSERPGTLASRKYPDDIPYELKTQRLNEIIALQGRMSLKSNEKEIGKTLKVLVEGPSKKNPEELCGRASSNKMCVFPSRGEKAGDYCTVEVVSVTSATLICTRID